MKALVAALAYTALLAGCAGTPFKWADARQITPGMTIAEVTRLMGTPTAVQSSNDTLTYVWVYVSSFSGSRTVRVVFRDGKATAAPPIPPEFQD